MFSLKKNISFNFLFTILSTGTTFLLMKVIFEYLNFDKSNYGLWLTIFSILSYIYMMDFGISNGLRNIITPLIGKDDKKVNEYISTSILINAIISIILLIIVNLILIIAPFDQLTKIRGYKISIEEFKLFIFIIFNLQIINFFFAGMKPVFHSYARTYLINFSQFLSNTLSIIILSMLTYLNINNNWAILANIFVGSQIFCILILSFMIVRKLNIKIKFVVDLDKMKLLWEIGIKFFFLQFSNLVLFNSLPIIVSIATSLEEASKFQLSYKLLSLFILGFTIVMGPLWTVILTEKSKGDLKNIKRIHKKLIKSIVIIAIIIFIFSFLQNYLIKLWMGINFNLSFRFDVLMSIYIVLNILCVVYQSLLNGLNVIKAQIIGYLSGSFLLLIAAYILTLYRQPIECVIFAGILSLIIPVSIMTYAFRNSIERI